MAPIYPKIQYVNGLFDNIRTLMESKKDALKDFVLSSTTSGGEPVIKVELALEFKKMDEEDVKRMNDDTLIAIYAVSKKFSKTMKHPDFDKCQNELMQSFFVGPNHGESDIVPGRVEQSDDSLMSKDGNTTEAGKQKIKAELMRILQHDKDVYDTLCLDSHIPFMTRFLFRSSGKKIDSTMLRQVYDEAKIMDVSVLRYPDSDTEYFKLYRLEIAATRTSTFNLIDRGIDADDDNVLNFTFQYKTFKPKRDFINRLPQHLKDKGAKGALELFNVKI